MKKYLIIILIIATFISILTGCSKKENIQFDKFYGETEKWLVIATTDNVFKFIYKGNVEDLKKNNNIGKVNFHYGTSLGSTGSTQLLNDTNSYQVIFEDDFITELTNTTFNGNKFINVQIAYADTNDSIDLAAYREYKVN